MSASRKVLEDTRDIFSILHDGVTSLWTHNKKLLTLHVDCEYLAERIDASYKSFYVECDEIQILEFRPWRNPVLSPVLWTDADDIFKAGLTILSADIDKDSVKITCNQSSKEYDYWGGTLSLSCSAIRIFDEGMRLMSIEELDNICNNYWDDCRKKLETIITSK